MEHRAYLGLHPQLFHLLLVREPLPLVWSHVPRLQQDYVGGSRLARAPSGLLVKYRT